jgi:hypothetical protein
MQQVRQAPRARRLEQVAACSRPATLRRDHRDVRRPLRGRRRPRCFAPGTYRNITGNKALALGLVAGARARGLRCSWAPTRSRPASTSCTLSPRPSDFGVMTFQAEDEIAAVGAALGAAYGGATRRDLHVERPRHRPQGETISLAVMPRAAAGDRATSSAAARRPGCRPRPSRPTSSRRCTAATARRRCPSIAAALARRLLRRRGRGVRIATTYRTPVMLLSDGYLANGAEPWLPARRRHPPGPIDPSSPPSRTDPRTATRLPALPARPGDPGPAVGHPRHARPGAPHRRHREGRHHGQHQLRPRQPRAHGPAARQAKVDGIVATSPTSSSTTRTGDADVLVLGWGSTWGPISGGEPGASATPAARSPLHICVTSTRCLPTPARCCARYPRVIVPEMNLGPAGDDPAGQAYLVDVQSYSRVRGLPISPAELAPYLIDVIDAEEALMTPPDCRRRNRPLAITPLNRKEFVSDQEVRWCPGCGDYAILAACSRTAANSGIKRENTVSCPASAARARFPYYLDTYGMHSIHGRAPAIATGLADAARPGRVGRHRRRRRPVDRRQPPDPRAAAQREPHDHAVQQPDLRADQGAVLPHLRDPARSPSRPPSARWTPVQPGHAGAGRRGDLRGPGARQRPQAPDRDAAGAAAHRGRALVEIYQNCPIFNDGAFETTRG